MTGQVIGQATGPGSLVERMAAELKSWGDERRDDKAQCVSTLERVRKNMSEAIAVWQDILSSAPESGDKFTFVLWVGPERARALHRIHLDARDAGAVLTEISGIRFKDSMGIVEEIDVVEAYGELKPDETASSRANDALQILGKREERIAAAIAAM